MWLSLHNATDSSLALPAFNCELGPRVALGCLSGIQYPLVGASHPLGCVILTEVNFLSVSWQPFFTDFLNSVTWICCFQQCLIFHVYLLGELHLLSKNLHCQSWKQLKCPPVGKLMNSWWSLHSRRLLSLVPCERSQSQKIKTIGIHLLETLEKAKL